MVEDVLLASNNSKIRLPPISYTDLGQSPPILNGQRCMGNKKEQAVVHSGLSKEIGMVSNEQQSWLFTLGTQAPFYPGLLPGSAGQDVLENLFRQSYLLTDIPFFQLVVQRLAQALGVRAAYVATYGEHGEVRTVAFWLDNRLVPAVVYDVETAPCFDLVQNGALRYVEAVTAVYPTFCAQLGVQADCYLGVPLTATNGRLLGHIGLLHDRPFQLPLANWSVWPLLLARAAIELERLQTAVQQTSTLHDLECRAEQLAALYEAALDLTPSPAWPELTQVIGERIATLLRCPTSALFLELYLTDAKSQRLHLQQRQPGNSRPVYLCEPPTPELRHYVAQTGEAHIASARPQEAMIYLMPDEARCIHIVRSSILLPLISGEKVVGLLYLGLRECTTFTPDLIGALMAFSDMLADLLQRMACVHDMQAKLAQSEKELMDVETRCQALDQLRAKLIHDVTQAFFTPITSVRLYLDLLAYCRLDQNAQRYVDVLRAKTQQLIQFAEDALHLSRLEQVPPQTQFRPVTLQRDLAHMIALYAELAGQAGLFFSFQPDDRLPPVWGESNQIRQAVSVLLDNAIAYTPRGQIRVRLLTNGANTQLCVQVEDTGIGVAAAEIPHLFDRFYRGSQAGQQQVPGRGLGLAIALEIARLHGGRLAVESEIGSGSVFRLWLPFVAENDMTTLSACRLAND